MRIDNQHVRELARKFHRSWRAELWCFVADDVRAALIDSMVMESVAMAHAVDAQRPLTPMQIMELRCDLAEELHRGAHQRVSYRFVASTPDTVVWP